MAYLVGESGGFVCGLEITTTLLKAENPDSYQVTFTVDSNVIFHRLYAVLNGDFLTHYWMLEMAYILQASNNVLTERHHFSLGSHNRSPLHPITLDASTGWLHLILQGKKRNSKDFSIVAVQMYAQTNFYVTNEMSSPFQEFVRQQFFCCVKDAQQFGKDLEKECRLAENIRESQYVE